MFWRSSLFILLAGLVMAGSAHAESTASPTSLDEVRLTMGKWIETQQIISKERKEWQQGREILQSKLDLMKKEIVTLEEKIKEAQAGVVEANKKRDDLVAENDELKAAGVQLTSEVGTLETELKKLHPALPDPVKTRLEPLHQRIPEDPAKTKVSIAERFQNVLGILNEVNKANNEITVNYEVHELTGGKPAEVKAIYVGLAQAYYVSAQGEAGIGRPSPTGWQWKPDNSVARDVMLALEIIQGKHSPAFVPLPVNLQ